MRMYMNVFGLLTLCLGLVACAEATTNACGDGDAVNVNGSTYCVYKQNVVIVGGFDCPASMPFRMDFERATVCSDHGFDGLDVPEDICARAFVPCTEPNESDAGGPPKSCGGTVCAMANATVRCSTSGVCILDSCSAGFGSCDGQPGNGCETPVGACGTCACQCELEICDGEDNDCDALVDEQCPDAAVMDGSPCAEVRAEACDGVDNDCDGVIDNNTADADCSAPNGSSVCDFGTCMLAICNAGFGDCNANPLDGCETDFSSRDNCGACGVYCSEVCVSGTDGYVCAETLQ